jgi:hypothetical protein
MRAVRRVEVESGVAGVRRFDTTYEVADGRQFVITEFEDEEAPEPDAGSQT